MGGHRKGLGDAHGFGLSMGKAVLGWQLKPNAVPSSWPGYHAANGVQGPPHFMGWGRKESVAVLSSRAQLLSWGISGTSERALQQLLLLGVVVSLASA